MEAEKSQIMLRIEWHDRRAAGDDCTCSLAEFLEVNAESAPWPQVEALKVGESVDLDWTTVTRIADGSPRVPAISDEEMRAEEFRRLNEQRTANDNVNRLLALHRSRR